MAVQKSDRWRHRKAPGAVRIWTCTRRVIYFCIPIFLFVWTSTAHAQNYVWSSHYGGVYNDAGYNAVSTNDRGYAAVGSTFSYGSGDYDVYLLKLDSLGDTLWVRTYGGSRTDIGHDLQATADGGFVVVGTTTSFGRGKEDVYVLRTDSLGNLLWSRTYGGAATDEGWSIRATYDGGFIIGGSTSSSGAGYADLYLLKISAAGDSLWSRAYGGPGGESGYAVRQTRDSGFIAVGATGSFGEGYSSMYVVRTTSNGDSLWATTYGGPKADLGYSVEIAPDGGFLFAGATASYGMGYYDAYLVKTDAGGLVEWEHTYGGTLDDRAYAVSMTSDGGFLMVGTTESFGAGSADLYAVKVDPMGEIVWSQTFGGTQADYCRAVVKNRAGQFVLVGYTYSYSAGGSDLYLVTMSGDQATPVIEPWPSLPDGYALLQNYPNPFNLSTRIEYSIPRSGPVNLTIFNLLGQPVREWQFRQVTQGNHTIDWDGRSGSGEVVATGVYFYRIEAGGFTASRKMLLMK